MSEKDFKVVDRRHTAGHQDEQTTKKGAGFTMEEKEEAAHEPMQLDFSTFVLSLATSALINLGLAPDPMTNEVQVNLEIARQNIELLSILKDKTKGNLTADEQKLIDGLLTEARLKFVEISKARK